jgi:Tfp pilus assembly protein PilF
MVARSYLTARDHGAAVKWAEKSIRQRPNWAFSHFVRASALAQLRRWTEAEAAIQRCLTLDSGCVDWEFNQSAARYANPADHHHILDGVRQLGFG